MRRGAAKGGEPLNGFLHLCGIAHRHGHGVVNHHHGHRADQYFCTSHSDHACRRCRNAIDLDRDIVRIIHEHVIDLGSRHTVPAWAVDPDRDVSASAHQFLFKKLGCDVIVKPAFLGDGAVEEQRPFRRSCLRRRLVLPLPELLHRGFPPFPFVYLQKPRRFQAGAYCH